MVNKIKKIVSEEFKRALDDSEEKKIEKKRNLALGVAAVSAVTVFGIILTI